MQQSRTRQTVQESSTMAPGKGKVDESRAFLAVRTPGFAIAAKGARGVVGHKTLRTGFARSLAFERLIRRLIAGRARGRSDGRELARNARRTAGWSGRLACRRVLAGVAVRASGRPRIGSVRAVRAVRAGDFARRRCGRRGLARDAARAAHCRPRADGVFSSLTVRARDHTRDDCVLASLDS